MREILFRGKRADNENWVCGLLVKQVDLDGSDELCIQTWERDNEGVSSRVISVIPSTVGQYTGLTDKNGVRIFEGDIVKHYTGCPLKEYSVDIGRIFWHQSTQRYLRTSSIFPDDCAELFETKEYEVIGNIHDNPELVKGV